MINTVPTYSDLHAIGAAARAVAKKVEALAENLRASETVDRPHSFAVKMADDMIDIASGTGCCEDRDLMLRGWTPETLAQHGAEANRIARRAAGEV